MVRASAWVLNFDADEELARPRGYHPPRAVLARFDALAELMRPLLGPADILVRDADDASARDPVGYVGRTWCPTPRALTLLERFGFTPAPSPALEILRRVNDRGFSTELGATLPGAAFATTEGEVERLAGGPTPSGIWLLKRAHGFAGRGRRMVRAGALDEADRRWVSGSLRVGGVTVEPWVERRGDFALHGYVERAGRVHLGDPTVQECDLTGAWRGSSLASDDDLPRDQRVELVTEAAATGSALHRAGYFGPFGIDAFRWIDEKGELRFCTRCDVNARYTMGWPVGMGARRPDLAEAA